MISSGQLLWRDVTITNELGLHARSAAKLSQTARKAGGRVWLEFDGERVDAKQIIDVLTLGAARGDTIRIGVEQDGDLATLADIVGLVSSGFGE